MSTIYTLKAPALCVPPLPDCDAAVALGLWPDIAEEIADDKLRAAALRAQDIVDSTSGRERATAYLRRAEREAEEDTQMEGCRLIAGTVTALLLSGILWLLLCLACAKGGL